MSNKIFKKEDINILYKNKFVKNISEKALTYTDEFKKYSICAIKIHHITQKKFPVGIADSISWYIMQTNLLDWGWAWETIK